MMQWVGAGRNVPERKEAELPGLQIFRAKSRLALEDAPGAPPPRAAQQAQVEQQLQRTVAPAGGVGCVAQGAALGGAACGDGAPGLEESLRHPGRGKRAAAEAPEREEQEAMVRKRPAAKREALREPPAAEPEREAVQEPRNARHEDAPVYGTVKAEFYSAKSYIREARPEGGWRMVVGDTSRRRNEVCAKLLPHVLVGKARQELYALREQIAEQLSVGQQGAGVGVRQAEAPHWQVQV